MTFDELKVLREAAYRTVKKEGKLFKVLFHFVTSDWHATIETQYGVKPLPNSVKV